MDDLNFLDSNMFKLSKGLYILGDAPPVYKKEWEALEQGFGEKAFSYFQGIKKIRQLTGAHLFTAKHAMDFFKYGNYIEPFEVEIYGRRCS
jgi:hypothetical protein